MKKKTKKTLIGVLIGLLTVGSLGLVFTLDPVKDIFEGDKKEEIKEEVDTSVSEVEAKEVYTKYVGFKFQFENTSSNFIQFRECVLSFNSYSNEVVTSDNLASMIIDYYGNSLDPSYTGGFPLFHFLETNNKGYFEFNFLLNRYPGDTGLDYIYFKYYERNIDKTNAYIVDFSVNMDIEGTVNGNINGYDSSGKSLTGSTFTYQLKDYTLYEA